MDADRQWYKACIGLEADSVGRGDPFYKIPVASGRALIVPDATQDPRFSEHPFVAGHPGIRLYAGMPLILDGDKCVGTICAIDMKPRDFTCRDEVMLADLALLVQTGLEFRRTSTTDTLTETLTRRGFKFAAARLG